tara:strand:+ start:2240 stop:4525 length:2286 start_codon:yes stop_codon:yes gene_type:complete
MATYVNDLRLKEIATGDESGTWGTSTNTNLELIGEALSFGTEAITTNADTHTTTVADGASDPGRAMYLKYTGTLDSACTITIAPNTISRMQFIENGTSGSQNIIISQGSGANITIPPGDTKAVYLDGAGSGAAVVDAFASLSTVDLKVQDDLTVTDDVSIGGALTLTGNGDFNGDLDVDGTTNLDVVDIDGAVDMASTLQVDGAITSSAGATITVTDNSDNLTLTSTDADANAGPNLRMYRNSGSPADSDLLGRIDFEGRNNNSQDVVYGSISSTIISAADGSEDGMLSIKTMHGGTEVKRIRLQTSEAVFNEDSNDIDFRVESNSNTHMLFVDAGNDRVGIGTAPAQLFHVVGADGTLALFSNNSDADLNIKTASAVTLLTPSTGTLAFGTSNTERMRIDSSGNLGISTTSPEGLLHVHGGNSGSSYTADGADKIILEHSDSVAMDIRTPTDGVGIILFSDTTRARGLIGYEHSADAFKINTAGSERMRIDSSGNVGIGTTSPSKKLAISDGGAQGIELSPQESGVSRIFSFNRSSSAYTTLQIQGDDIRFGTGSSAAERMRITSAGLLLIGATSGLSGYSGSKLQVSQSAVDYVTGFANTRSTGSENFGVRIQYPNATANGTSNHFLFCDDATAKRFAVRSNGGIENYQSNDVNLSDERVKKNIVDTPDTLEIIKNLKVRDFQYKDQTDDKVHTGLIAQETETVDASLVDQDGWSDKAPEGEEPYKAIYNTDLMFKMLKAIQEQQEQIEQLKTKIETLQ